MKFCVGYQMRNDDGFIRQILREKDRVYEVYFAFGDTPSGRHGTLDGSGLLPHEAMERQLSDLASLSEGGVPLNVLYNANCYGERAESRAFFCEIGDTLAYLTENFGVRSVTTTSPLIAKFVKENFPELKTRASVNMEIGTVRGMDYLSDVFDGYYMKREFNRDLCRIRELSGWCRDNGKELFMLANSGCLNDCSSHVFHDNLVAHEKDIARLDNAYLFRGTCWDYLSKPEKQVSLVRDTNYVRPEDMHLYEGYFTAAKLATRVNSSPERVLDAYFCGRYVGSPLDLCEPNYAGVLFPRFLDNGKFPEDFGKRVMTCDKRCETCGYCKQVFTNSLVNLEENIC